jgi:CxxC motif-containing protein (DUF1111 family)
MPVSSQSQVRVSRSVVKALAASCAACISAVSIAGGPIQPQPKMGDPLHGLTPSQLDRFQKGLVAFTTNLSVGGGAGPFFGLGPVFNKANCANCHNNPVGGTGSISVTRFGISDKGVFDPLEDHGGSLLQATAITPECLEVIPDIPNLVTSPRVTNSALAFGLIEAISNADLLANRDAQPLALRGVAHMVSAFEDPAKTPPNSHVGRFGWKAQVATVLTFSADASFNEMGLTNRFITEENDPNGIYPPSLKECDDGVADPDDVADSEGFEFIDRVTDFQRFLAQPPQTPRSGMSGELVFNNLGCNVCHTKSFTTADDPRLEDSIRNKVIYPYSDFLLHDMGLNADFIVQGMGTEQLIKTPPLWGIRVRDPLWHNGSVTGSTFEERMDAAILMHDGGVLSQGHAMVQVYMDSQQTTPEDKAALFAFLFSLGRMEFDMVTSLENVIDLDDFNAFAACYTGADVLYGNPKTENLPDLPCAVSDIDQDGDIDVDDLASFMLVYNGARRDCNQNGIVDLLEIADGSLADADFNGIPDACEPTCDQDTNGSGGVDVDDLLTVINEWGDCDDPPAPCSGDLTLSRSVDVDDLLALINAWGPCR